MFLKNFQLFNYKSYIDSELIEFTPGINIIIGQNNSGKTALLEALALKLSSNPHRSTKTRPTLFSKINEKSRAEITLSIEKHELRRVLEEIPPPLGFPEPGGDWWSGEAEDARKIIESFEEWLDEPNPIEFSLSLSSDPQAEEKQEKITEGLTFNFYSYSDLPKPDKDGYYSYINISQGKYGNISANLIYEDEKNPECIGYWIPVAYNTFQGSYKQTIAYKVFDLFRNRIYRFYAERLNIASCSCKGSAELKPDASNLAEVLHLLPNKNPSKSELLNRFLSDIFPHIAYVSSIETEPSTVEIRLWTIEAAREGREDLTFSLSDCGSGISQVLAILYVIITSQLPRSIIIDEPPSFLHPGAAKKLVEILKGFHQHQYFIATHSPMLITAAHPCRIIKLVPDGCQTKASIINTDETVEQQSILSEVGVRLSDVFGADNILWVEGLTEEQCFPIILEKVAKKSLKGTVILAVKNTGDLEQKNKISAKIIFDIYDKLSGGRSLFPPAIGFVLDSEGKTKAQMEDIKRRSPNSIKFLKQRMYENYLLIPEAIAAVINKNDLGRKAPLMDTEVCEWIKQKRQAKAYLNVSHQKDISDEAWFEEVDASTLLKELFAELSEARVEFSKPIRSYELTAWIIEHKPEHFFDLSEFLK
jgi:AAA15 family ATPase/GTPase